MVCHNRIDITNAKWLHNKTDHELRDKNITNYYIN